MWRNCSPAQGQSHLRAAEQEVAGYADSRELTFESFESITVTENHVKQLHGVLLKYSSKDQEHRRHYKKVPNHVEAFGPDDKSPGIVFETATTLETPGWMKELLNWFNDSVSEETRASVDTSLSVTCTSNPRLGTKRLSTRPSPHERQKADHAVRGGNFGLNPVRKCCEVPKRFE